MHVSTPVPVGVDGQELPQAASAVATLDLEPPHGVGTEDAGLGQQLTDPPLGAEEGTFPECELPVTRAALQPSYSPQFVAGPLSLFGRTVCSACVERQSLASGAQRWCLVLSPMFIPHGTYSASGCRAEGVCHTDGGHLH